MTGRQDNDDRLVGQIRGRIRTEGRMFRSLFIVALIMAAIFYGGWKFHLPIQTSGTAALSVLILWIVYAYVVIRAVPPVIGDYDDAILRRTIDDQHRRWRWAFFLTFLLTGGLTAAIYLLPDLMSYLLHRRQLAAPATFGFNPGNATLMMYLAITAVFAAFQVCFGPRFLTGRYRRALNDEVTAAMQRSAATFGYLLAIAAMAGILCASAIRPQWGLAALPGALAASVILPGLYFLTLQWRAERDG